MTHEFLPTYALDRAALRSKFHRPDPEEFKREADRVAELLSPDPDALGRLTAHVGDGFRGIGVVAVLGAIAS